jgi:hypothetical protein
MDRRVNHHPPRRSDFEPSATTRELTPRRTGSVATYFQQDCPVCGRPLQIRVEHLGKRVLCSHCRCQFVCCDATQDTRDHENCSALSRAERLLALLDRRMEARNRTGVDCLPEVRPRPEYSTPNLGPSQALALPSR